MGNIASFMNEQKMGPLEAGMANRGGVPVMATPAVVIPVSAKITAGIVAFTVPVGAYVAGRVVN